MNIFEISLYSTMRGLGFNQDASNALYQSLLIKDHSQHLQLLNPSILACAFYSTKFELDGDLFSSPEFDAMVRPRLPEETPSVLQTLLRYIIYLRSLDILNRNSYGVVEEYV